MEAVKPASKHSPGNIKEKDKKVTEHFVKPWSLLVAEG